MEAGLAARAARTTCQRDGRPQTSCRTFGRDDFMRLPCPAASTIAAGPVDVRRGGNLKLDPPVGARLWHREERGRASCIVERWPYWPLVQWQDAGFWSRRSAFESRGA